ncbi:MAG: dynamin family protein [Cyanobacteria bacterium P01_G01_bin.39]
MAELINQPSSQNLQDYVGELLELASSESLPEENINIVRTSCKQAVSHTFVIAFAGLRSAGKSTTINALLERELLYSHAGHATGTVCYISSLAPSDTEEKIEITFINQSQIQAEVEDLCMTLGIKSPGGVTQPEVKKNLERELRLKDRDGIPDKTSQSIKLLEDLLTNYDKYQSYITEKNTVLTLEPINEETLKQAAEYAAWEKEGKEEQREVGGSLVVERIDYYCRNPLLDSGNVLLDLPGIDAPIKRDRDLTENRLKDEKTGAVVFMPSLAYEGALSPEEIEINSLIKENTGIRSRVFFVFNRVDETLSDAQTRNRFSQSLDSDFVFLSQDSEDETKRVYCTSALLGFYSSVIKKYIDQHGTKAINIPDAIEHGIKVGDSKIPKKYLVSLVYYLRYEKKLNLTTASDPSNSDVLAKEIKEIINNYSSVFEEVIAESGIPQLQQSISHYVEFKKLPQLYQQLNVDLQSLCRKLRAKYKASKEDLDNYPKTTEELKNEAKKEIKQKLVIIQNNFVEHLDKIRNDFKIKYWNELDEEYKLVKQNITQSLKNLIDNNGSDFYLDELYTKASSNEHNKEKYGTAPILSIFVELFYLLSAKFQKSLVKECKKVTQKAFDLLRNEIQKQDYYSTLENLLGDEVFFLFEIIDLEGKIFESIIKDRAMVISQGFIRESPHFYEEINNRTKEVSESSMSLSFIEILTEILKNTDGKYGSPKRDKNIENLIMDFFKVQFSTDEETLKTLYDDLDLQITISFQERLKSISKELRDKIIQQEKVAVEKSYLNLEVEAQSKLANYETQKEELKAKISKYNQITNEIKNNQDFKKFKLSNLSNCEIVI